MDPWHAQRGCVGLKRQVVGAKDQQISPRQRVWRRPVPYPSTRTAPARWAFSQAGGRPRRSPLPAASRLGLKIFFINLFAFPA